LNETVDSVAANPHPRCLLTELEDGTGVVLNLETKFYHTLNATGVSLWKAIAEGVASEGELTRKLVSEFEVTDEIALADIRLALAQFEREGLIVRPGAPRK
jgi:Coenzyme PQQ synthesis protein D (PqqD)